MFLCMKKVNDLSLTRMLDIFALVRYNSQNDSYR